MRLSFESPGDGTASYREGLGKNRHTWPVVCVQWNTAAAGEWLTEAFIMR